MTMLTFLRSVHILVVASVFVFGPNVSAEVFSSPTEGVEVDISDVRSGLNKLDAKWKDIWNADGPEKYLQKKKPSGSFKSALELFVSLEQSSGDCSLKGFEIIAKCYEAVNYKPLEYDGPYLKPTKFHLRLTFDRIHENQSKRCLPIYKEQFHQLVKEVDNEDLKKLEKAFETLNSESFRLLKWFPDPTYPLNRVLVRMSTPQFTGASNKLAVVEIVGQVAKQLMQSPRWKELKSASRVPKDVFDEYLFKPCKNFRTKLGSILTPVRFYANVLYHQEAEQKEYIYGDREFYQGLVNNRLCMSLLREQNKLYSHLNEAWREVSSKL